ncbi:hypothetical protein GPY51_22570 [Photorhabdus laumondii subsp. laumondii]|uniref:Uncharacterized protein n=1 Tax=Photorhabdus laumondii subsp. laumondii TaxID=141679 RepID=A0A6L9JX10_PHOLM|nr:MULTISPECIES: hypothetical protein [Photorhabdus]MCC8386158.1 hypothetical protein [Photorhabdus laumondii]MCC8388836.1 hypothetical protein [Photorhabdus laumondii]MCC8415305.1 hypothetical protein [Photorhabdus laumondii]MCZ1250613.1 hypothetical protein [Photorhabdus laumondii subsp. laumondii]NDK97142.1 hypothetical protein [Photorhabdus laumondii subsp. laumondii]
MNKNTESLISACHELARVASCDDYLILNEIADKLRFLRKERDSYKEMFSDSCKGLAAIANAAGIKAENDSGSPRQVIEKIESMLNVDWHFTNHPNIENGDEKPCWAYVKVTYKKGDYAYNELSCEMEKVVEDKNNYYIKLLTYRNEWPQKSENTMNWYHLVEGDVSLQRNEEVIAWIELEIPDKPELNKE